MSNPFVADFDGDMLNGELHFSPRPPTIPKKYFKRKRQDFNNKSLYQKNLIRKGLRALDRLTSKK